MDHRAYHLQNPAHNAVTRALTTGRLKRRPCEECGEPGQAHHDSYYPDKWLKVRWLCGKHHREWHTKNEPEWPTIFEFHPSDQERFVFDGRRGRPPKPWFRAQTRSWYVTLNGKAFQLHRDKEKAYKRFFELLKEHRPQEEDSPSSKMQ